MNPLLFITARRKVTGRLVDLAFGLGRSRNVISILHKNTEDGKRHDLLVAGEDEFACTGLSDLSSGTG